MTGGRYLITTVAQPATCRECHAPILTGHEDGLIATVDIQPIPPEIEWLILLTGLWTYNRNRIGELWHRHNLIIRHGPPRPGITIHAQHPCTRRKATR
jgi:hypothetical protein